MADLTDEDLDSYKKVFDYYDNNGNGYITTEEIFRILKLLQVPVAKSELADMMAEVDLDNTGTIEWKEFLELMTKKWKEFDMKEAMQSAFNIFDKDKGNELGSSELLKIFDVMFPGKFTEKDIILMVKENSAKGLDSMDFDDFKRLVFGNVTL